MDTSTNSRFGKKAMSLFLSGAMVVAFAPAVAAPLAEAAYEGQKIVVNYDFNGGVDAKAGQTDELKTSVEAEVVATDGIVLQDASANLFLGKADSGYAFSGWTWSYDADVDGNYDGPEDVKDAAVTGNKIPDVLTKVDNKGKAITVKANYSAPTVSDPGTSWVAQDETGKGTKLNFAIANTGVIEADDYELSLRKDGAATGFKTAWDEKSANPYTVDLEAANVALSAGTYTLVLTDTTKGVEVSRANVDIATLRVEGGEGSTFARFADTTKTVANAQTAFIYVPESGINYATALENAAKASSADCLVPKLDGSELKGFKDGGDFAVTWDGTDFTAADGYKASDADTLIKGTGGTILNAAYKEVSVDSISYDKATRNFTVVAEDLELIPGSYTVTITAPDGSVVGKYANAASDTLTLDDSLKDTTGEYKFSLTAPLDAAPAGGTYIAKLSYQKPSGGGDPTQVEKTADCTVEAPAEIFSPGFTYDPEADGAGQLRFVGTMGATGYDIYYTTDLTAPAPTLTGSKLDTTGWTKYEDESKYLPIAADDVDCYRLVTVAQDLTSDPLTSEVATLIPNGTATTGALGKVATFAKDVLDRKVIDRDSIWYSDVDDVEETASTVQQAIVDTGFRFYTDGTEWDEDVNDSKEAILEAVADYYMDILSDYNDFKDPVTGDDSLNYLTDDDWDAATDAIGDVVTAFIKNHDADTTNNVEGYDSDIAYVAAIENAAKAGIAKVAPVADEAEKQQIIDEHAAGAFSDAVKSELQELPTDTAKLKELIDTYQASYNRLTDAQKALVPQDVMDLMAKAQKAYEDATAPAVDANIAKVEKIKPTVAAKAVKGKKLKVTVKAAKAKGIKVAYKIQYRVNGKGKYKTVSVKANAKGKATKTIKKLKKGKKYQVKAYVTYGSTKSKVSKVKKSAKIK